MKLTGNPSRIRIPSGRRRKHSRGMLLVWISILLPFLVKAEKAYPLGCSHRDPTYYDYENSIFPPVPITIGNGVGTITNVPIKTKDDYLLTKRLGAGKFSDVFEAVDAEQERRRKILSSSLTVSSSTTSNNNAYDNGIIDSETLVVLKCLKPVAEKKIKRELLVLRHASKLPNLARIKALVLPNEYGGTKTNNGKGTTSNKNRIKSMPTLVLEHSHGDWFCHPVKQLKQRLLQQQQHQTAGATTSAYPESASYLIEYEIRYYLLHLLVALDHLHSCGIMHRDVKPRNVLIDRRATASVHGLPPLAFSASSRTTPVFAASRNSPLMLIDLGLADFYHPGTRYNVRVASRHYKSPELLLGPSFGYYDYAIDLWGVGCIMAGLLFRKEPFFRGKNNVDQLGVIIQVLGTTDLLRHVTTHEKSGYEFLPDDVKVLIEEYITQGEHVHRRPWTDFLPATSNEGTRQQQQQSLQQQQQQQQQSLRSPTLFQSQGMDLLDKLLVYDGDQRWTARQAMYHPFFDEVRRDVLGQVRLPA